MNFFIERGRCIVLARLAVAMAHAFVLVRPVGREGKIILVVCTRAFALSRGSGLALWWRKRKSSSGIHTAERTINGTSTVATRLYVKLVTQLSGLLEKSDGLALDLHCIYVAVYTYSVVCVLPLCVALDLALDRVAVRRPCRGTSASYRLALVS